MKHAGNGRPVAWRAWVFATLAICALATFCSCGPEAGRPAAARWYKGNTHVHSRWSDGSDFPEMVAEWYKAHGYDFLVVADHNTVQKGRKWVDCANPKHLERLAEYKAKWGDDWVETGQRTDEKTGSQITTARAKRLKEYRGRIEEPGRFLLVRGEEITGQHEKTQVHLCAVNLAEAVPPKKGSSIAETIANDIAAVRAQAARVGRPMLVHLNHPNWGGPVPVEQFVGVAALKFFEVMNSRPTDVYNRGDAKLLSTDRLWDVLLAKRLGDLGLGPVYAVAADDSHDTRGSGGGWIVVRAAALEPASLIAAMERSDFYASTGVTLRDVRREGDQIVVEVDPEPGVTYVTQFIGTLPGYDRSREGEKDEKGNLLPPTERYSPDIGKVLGEVKGTRAAYDITGRELYVRAKVISSRYLPHPDPKKRATDKGEPAVAWTQPFVVRPAAN